MQLTSKEWNIFKLQWKAVAFPCQKEENVPFVLFQSLLFFFFFFYLERSKASQKRREHGTNVLITFIMTLINITNDFLKKIQQIAASQVNNKPWYCQWVAPLIMCWRSSKLLSQQWHNIKIKWSPTESLSLVNSRFLRVTDGMESSPSTALPSCWEIRYTDLTSSQPLSLCNLIWLYPSLLHHPSIPQLGRAVEAQRLNLEAAAQVNPRLFPACKRLMTVGWKYTH